MFMQLVKAVLHAQMSAMTDHTAAPYQFVEGAKRTGATLLLGFPNYWVFQGRSFGITAVTSTSLNIPPATNPSRTQSNAAHQSL